MTCSFFLLGGPGKYDMGTLLYFQSVNKFYVWLICAVDAFLTFSYFVLRMGGFLAVEGKESMHCLE